jgi:hypothetical protein
MANIIGTSYEGGPDFYTRKAQQLGATIAGVRDRWAANREQERGRELAEIDRFFRAAQGMPQLATTWGEDIKARYGDKHPGVSEMIDEIKNRYETVAGAKRAWTDAWSGLQADYANRGQEIAAMPQSMPPVIPGGTGPSAFPLNVPNMGQVAAAQSHAQVQPGYFPRQAMQGLPPAQQLELNRLIQEEKFSIPDPMRVFDVNRDAPAEFKTLAAAESGQFGPPNSTLARAARIGFGLEQKPSVLQQQDYWMTERVAREENKQAAIRQSAEANEKAAKQRHEQQVARIKLQDSLARSRESNRFSHEKGLIDYRKEASGDAGTPRISAELLMRDSRSAVKDFDDGLRLVLKEKRGQELVLAKQAFLRSYGGRRPIPLSGAQARILAGEINSRVVDGSLPAEEAEAAAIRASADAMSRMGRGEGPVQAVKNGVEAALAAGSGGRQRPASTMPAEPAEPESLEPITDADEIGVSEPAIGEPEDDPADVRLEAESAIRERHPEWSDSQVDDAVEAFLRSQGGGR